jgi:hypothetical protein
MTGCRLYHDAASSRQSGVGFDGTLEFHDSHMAFVQRKDPEPAAGGVERASGTLSFHKVSETMR